MSSDAASAPGPLSRAERQALTRTALVEAARRVFARDGFHGASLEAIAADAGYSKGAVYSNFAGKADLFLAVMDVDLARLDIEYWDPFVRIDAGGEEHNSIVGAHLDAPADEQVGIGFALATLEFIASAGRDTDLQVALRSRVAMLVDAYRQVADRQRDPDETLDDDEVASLLAALDQGTALLLLGGWPTVDTRLLRVGLQRLLRPAPDEPGQRKVRPSPR